MDLTKMIFNFCILREEMAMKERRSYKTKQYQEILSYMEESRGHHVNVNALYRHFQEAGSPVGLTTIYRHLERMEEEGLVVRYALDEKLGACFEYVGRECQGRERPNFHFICEKCGSLIHVECSEVTHFQQHIRNDHGFAVDPYRTVFYGLCKNCQDS
jgi:Fur family ferric uptake transcriptional regulator